MCHQRPNLSAMAGRKLAGSAMPDRQERSGAWIAVLCVCLFAIPVVPLRAQAPAADFPRQVRQRSAESAWDAAAPSAKATRAAVVAALEAARQFLLRQQRADGLITCDLDLEHHRKLPANDPAREAFGLWALAMLCGERPTPETQRAFIRGLNVYVENTEPQACGAAAPLQPGDSEIKTVMVASLCLAIMDFVAAQERSPKPEDVELQRKLLGQYVAWLQKMEAADGSWAVKYIPVANERDTTSEPVCDSACLLVYCRAAHDFGFKELLPRIRESARKLGTHYLLDAWQGKADPRPGLLFAPLGCQAFLEYSRRDWEEATTYGDLTLATAWWLSRQLEVASRDTNLATNAQVLLAAYQVATDRKLPEVQERLRQLTEPLLARTIRLQADGPLWKENALVQRFQLRDFCTGGFLSSDDGMRIRIDGLAAPVQLLTTALPLFYPEKPAAVPVPSATERGASRDKAAGGSVSK